MTTAIELENFKLKMNSNDNSNVNLNFDSLILRGNLYFNIFNDYEKARNDFNHVINLYYHFINNNNNNNNNNKNKNNEINLNNNNNNNNNNDNDNNNNNNININIEKIFIKRAFVNAADNKFKNAIEDCNKAIEIEPLNFEGFRARSICYYLYKKIDLAEKDIEKAIEISSNFMFDDIILEDLFSIQKTIALRIPYHL